MALLTVSVLFMLEVGLSTTLSQNIALDLEGSELSQKYTSVALKGLGLSSVLQTWMDGWMDVF